MSRKRSATRSRSRKALHLHKPNGRLTQRVQEVGPERCILFFVNEKIRDEQLVAIPMEDDLLDAAVDWTIDRVKEVQGTMRAYQSDPLSVEGGDERDSKTGKLEVSESLTQQCTACGHRFGCDSYEERLGSATHPDVNVYNVSKN